MLHDQSGHSKLEKKHKKPRIRWTNRACFSLFFCDIQLENGLVVLSTLGSYVIQASEPARGRCIYTCCIYELQSSCSMF